VAQFLETLLGHATAGHSLLLFGRWGVGKTTLLSALCAEVRASGRPCAFAQGRPGECFTVRKLDAATVIVAASNRCRTIEELELAKATPAVRQNSSTASRLRGGAVARGRFLPKVIVAQAGLLTVPDPGRGA